MRCERMSEELTKQSLNDCSYGITYENMPLLVQNYHKRAIFNAEFMLNAKEI